MYVYIYIYIYIYGDFPFDPVRELYTNGPPPPNGRKPLLPQPCWLGSVGRSRPVSN